MAQFIDLVAQLASGGTQTRAGVGGGGKGD